MDGGASAFMLAGRIMRKVVLSAAAWMFMTPLASADSATVGSGVKSEITTHVRYDTMCQPNRVAIRILDAPANGTLAVEPKNITIGAQSERGVPQPSQCVGKSVEGVAIFYQSNPGFVGQDEFRYQRLNPRDAGDRFNLEIRYTVTVIPARTRDQGEIEKLIARFADLFNNGDASGVAALHADDAVVLPPGAGIVKGRSEIQAFWQQAAATLGGLKLTTLEMKPLGENAVRETGQFTVRTKGSQPRERTGKYVVIWERVGSEWKLGTDIWNEGK
jgi:uncharacterized protein (TIGR02246 family)